MLDQTQFLTFSPIKNIKGYLSQIYFEIFKGTAEVVLNLIPIHILAENMA